MHKLDQPDYSGVTLTSSPSPFSKTAGVLLLGTGGMMSKKSTADFDTACYMDEDIKLHPFAFRTHTHRHGKVVSGYRVRGSQWTLIGKRDPQLPQMFYPVENKEIVIEKGDTLAARCHMVNDENRDVYVGSTNDDEMCNFYMMYWVDGSQLLQDDSGCWSPGPPYYSWKNNASLTNIPTDTDQP